MAGSIGENPAVICVNLWKAVWMFARRGARYRERSFMPFPEFPEEPFFENTRLDPAKGWISNTAGSIGENPVAVSA